MEYQLAHRRRNLRRQHYILTGFPFRCNQDLPILYGYDHRMGQRRSTEMLNIERRMKKQSPHGFI